jgi:hypothetical protein
MHRPVPRTHSSCGKHGGVRGAPSSNECLTHDSDAALSPPPAEKPITAPGNQYTRSFGGIVDTSFDSGRK